MRCASIALCAAYLWVHYDIERYYRAAMLMCIGEGTNEILRQVIGKPP